MYSTCLFCHGRLGTNEVIERFPVGRRLAFDAAKGRLWVVCPRCARWNLTPLEERWEAIEDCERRFRATALRVSTDNVGLAKLREGLDLVRIGPALRPEIAAWRYGPQLGRRWRRHFVAKGAQAIGVGAVTAVAAVGFAAAAAAGPLGGGLWGAAVLVGMEYWEQRVLRRVVARVPAAGRGGGGPLVIRTRDLNAAQLVPVDGAVGGGGPGAAESWRVRLSHDEGDEVLTGEAATRISALLFARINREGGSPDDVREAVSVLEEQRDPARCYAWAADYVRRSRQGFELLKEFPLQIRLMLEMAAHDEAERGAMQGELGELARAWREAEEIAAIADELFPPAGVGSPLRGGGAQP
jgi:hypothetical protein